MADSSSFNAGEHEEPLLNNSTTNNREEGLALLTLSAVHPSLRPVDCSNNGEEYNFSCTSPSSFQVTVFFSALYLVAIGNSGYKPCACAFGADQFDEQNPKECQSKSSFFNWWNFGLYFGAIMSGVILNYIQDNMGWGYGFAITCFFMMLTLTIFLFGTKTFRYSMAEDKENPLMRMSRVFIAAIMNCRTSCSSSSTIKNAEVGIPNPVRIVAHQFK
ncbi:hypothetical protein MKW94_013855 [Papaver nudicaule]|uniref:Uncharacterized protein n=1 Tax=Papaver nudicaule TaxID=74823 RepID=A0AA41UYW6_PAPNU|nr:hypothetical protein [Papaver nudicaule]